jgi:hypothetical protein
VTIAIHDVLSGKHHKQTLPFVMLLPWGTQIGKYRVTAENFG